MSDGQLSLQLVVAKQGKGKADGRPALPKRGKQGLCLACGSLHSKVPGWSSATVRVSDGAPQIYAGQFHVKLDLCDHKQQAVAAALNSRKQDILALQQQLGAGQAVFVRYTSAAPQRTGICSARLQEVSTGLHLSRPLSRPRAQQAAAVEQPQQQALLGQEQDANCAHSSVAAAAGAPGAASAAGAAARVVLRSDTEIKLLEQKIADVRQQHAEVQHLLQQERLLHQQKQLQVADLQLKCSGQEQRVLALEVRCEQRAAQASSCRSSWTTNICAAHSSMTRYSNSSVRNARHLCAALTSRRSHGGPGALRGVVASCHSVNDMMRVVSIVLQASSCCCCCSSSSSSSSSSSRVGLWCR
ncbi:hypothetical protein COO60DRAFT_715876 [Scenedesmus sp. NREL 46B-D3]|nr:hypothetical protein COO60DRAFT_715876 [Scenedesmus sp. NREL 46B-D3]